MQSEDILIEEEVEESIPESTDLVEIIEYPAWKKIIFDLVKQEKMNPWDIDVVALSQKYLGKINDMKKLNFRIPANAILASSILVRLKSDEVTIEEEALLEELEREFTEDRIRYRVDVKIPDLAIPKRIPKRKISLDELIVIIEDVIKEEKTKKGGHGIMAALGNPFDLAYEVITDEAEFAVFSEQLLEKINSTLDGEGLTCFSNIIENRTRDEYVNVFISLLQLAEHGRVRVWQDEFFGEIFIRLVEDEPEEAG